MQPSMGCCEAIKSVMGKNYANFSGRARRSEYWFYSLFQYILNVILFSLDLSTSARAYSSYDRYGNSYSSRQLTVFGVINIIIALICFIPSLAVTVRRLHDIGKSGCCIFIALIPFVGIFILLYFLCIDSEAVPNEYGPSPKYNSSLQSNSNQQLIAQNSPVYQNNPSPLNAYPQQQPLTYQQPYQNPVPQQPYQSPVPPESYNSASVPAPQQPYQNPIPQQPYQSPVPPESYNSVSVPQQPYQNPVPPSGYNQQYPNPAPPEGFDKI